MGTVIEFTVLHETKERALEALNAAIAEIERVDKLFYEKNTESPVFAFNQHGEGKAKHPQEVLELISRSLELTSKTKGAFDITIGRLLELYGFESESPSPPSTEQITTALSSVGSQFLSIDLAKGELGKQVGQLELSMGGVAKGYAVDRAIAILKARGVHGALVNAGGDVGTLPRDDGKRWSIGIQHPRKSGFLHKVLKISSHAVATSGDYQKYYVFDGIRYHHLLNPKTGCPSRRVQSVTVVAPTTELADALATALFVLGPENGKSVLAGFADCFALWVDNEGEVVMSEGFTAFL
jgi:thiamine biosynthesis lipoprotein